GRATAIPELCGAGEVGGKSGGAREIFPEFAGGCGGTDGAVWTTGCAGGRDRDRGSASGSGWNSGAADSGAGTQAAGECGEFVSLGVGASAGAGEWARGCGVWDGGVWTGARWGGCRPGDGAVHQPATGRGPEWLRGVV